MLNPKKEDETRKRINSTQKKKQKTTTARARTTPPFIALAVSAVLFLSLLAAVQLASNNSIVAYAQTSNPTVTGRCEEGDDPSTWNLIFSISNLDPTVEWYYYYQIWWYGPEEMDFGYFVQDGYLTTGQENAIVEMSTDKEEEEQYNIVIPDDRFILYLIESRTTINRSAVVAWVYVTCEGSSPPPTDPAAPVLTVPAKEVVEATSPDGAVVQYQVSAQDDVDGSVPVTCTPASGNTFPIGTTTVTCTATDADGNEGTASFTVTVNPLPDDTTPPDITVPDDITEEATSPDGAEVSFVVSAQDDVDGSVPVTCTPASGNTFPIGTTTVTCTATDADGNEGTASFTVTVNPAPTDTTPPDITVPEGFTVEATSPDGAEVSFEVTAVDDVDGAVDVSCNHNSGSTFPIGTTTVTCTAVDAAGNEGTASFTVTVNSAPTDTTAPVVEITGAADRSGGQITEDRTTTKSNIKISFTATDDVGIDSTECRLDGGGAFTSCTSPVAYSGLSRGTHTVTVRATDAAGNLGYGEFTWTVSGGNKNPSSATTTALSTAPAATEEGEALATDEEVQKEQQQPTEEEEEEAAAPATDEGDTTTTDTSEQPTQQNGEGAAEEDTGGGSGQGPPDGRGGDGRGGDGRGGRGGGGEDDGGDVSEEEEG